MNFLKALNSIPKRPLNVAVTDITVPLKIVVTVTL